MSAEHFNLVPRFSQNCSFSALYFGLLENVMRQEFRKFCDSAQFRGVPRRRWRARGIVALWSAMSELVVTLVFVCSKPNAAGSCYAALLILPVSPFVGRFVRLSRTDL